MSAMTTSSGVSRDGNRSRARQQQEIAHLRETVAQLESELTRLRRHSHPRQEPFAGQWREIAERERHQRYAALTENARLRYKTERQLRIAKKMKAALNARDHVEAVSSLRGRALPDIISLGPSLLDNDAVAREIEASLSTLLAQCGTAFDHAAFQTKSMDVNHIEKRESLENGVQVISAERRVWPFGRAALSDAVLRLFGEMRALSDTALVKQEQLALVSSCKIEGDFASSNVAGLIEVAQFSGVSRFKVMARRYDFDTQTLIVFAGMTDPSDAIGTPCDGLLLQHSGWVRLRPLMDFHGATTYEAFHVSVPAVFDVVHDQKRKAALLASFMQATVGLHIDSGRDEVEKYLLLKASKSS